MKNFLGNGYSRRPLVAGLLLPSESVKALKDLNAFYQGNICVNSSQKGSVAETKFVEVALLDRVERQSWSMRLSLLAPELRAGGALNWIFSPGR